MAWTLFSLSWPAGSGDGMGWDAFTACKAKGKLKLEAVGGRWRLRAQHQWLSSSLPQEEQEAGMGPCAGGRSHLILSSQHTPLALQGRGKTGPARARRPQGPRN